MMTAPGLIIAAAGSGSGKTTVTLGLLRALRERGVIVAAAKAGPDYIDPGFHSAAGGRACVNLDPWAMRPATLATLATQAATDADLVICEGVMGLYDGIDASGAGSTAALAATLGWPVVMVVDARGMAASAGALVQGFANPPVSLARTGLQIAGVIFNRVGGEGHVRLLREALRLAVPQTPVLGCIPRAADIALPERHLGLVPAGEAADIERVIAAAARLIAGTIDLPALQALARPANPLPRPNTGSTIPPLGQRIAIASDNAFAFAYPWLLEGWRKAGAELSFFAPLADQAPAVDADAIYLPGGYPELHAGVLAANQNFLSGLRRAATRGATVYGECGGYMTLGEGLVDAEGRTHALAGLLPLTTSFAERRLHLGYREAVLTENGPLGPVGTRFRGHEFHYATMSRHNDTRLLFSALDAAGRDLPFAGHRVGTVMGSFIHLIDRANA